ncbi:MAG: flavin reductase [Candidatus Aegiribacteria sp.]|nr:flavin reductase [Candidatus Aegiribacteria sp.]
MKPFFKEIKPDDISESVFKLIAEDWFLLTACASAAGYNTMTASWGGMGQLWNKRVAFVFVRPGRHTWKFMENNGLFTMSFFPEDCRDALKYCGSHSGRETDKAVATGLTPFEPSAGTVAFEEAKLILVCRKLYYQDIQPKRFLDDEIDDLYPEKGYHRMYVGGIEKVLTSTAAEVPPD